MKRVVVIPGEGAGKEVIDAALPFLESIAVGIRFDRIETRPIPDPWGRLESRLRAAIGAAVRAGDIPGELGRSLLEGEWPVLGEMKWALYKRLLAPGCVERLWDCFPVDLPPEAPSDLRRADACLLGATDAGSGPFLLWLRQGFDLYANVRPVFSMRDERVDFVIVRENTQGFYSFIERRETDRMAVSLRVVTREASARICRYAVAEARRRASSGLPGMVAVVHKANVLRETCGLFRDACIGILRESGVPYEEMHVDACALALLKNPERFNVVVTTNLFGDILSDLAAFHMGGLGLAPSANYGESFALFEPVHGSAPDIAGKGVANPFAALLSGAMLLEYCGLRREGERLRRCVARCVRGGDVTPDLGGGLSTHQAVERVAHAYEAAAAPSGAG